MERRWTHVTSTTYYCYHLRASPIAQAGRPPDGCCRYCGCPNIPLRILELCACDGEKETNARMRSESLDDNDMAVVTTAGAPGSPQTPDVVARVARNHVECVSFYISTYWSRSHQGWQQILRLTGRHLSASADAHQHVYRDTGPERRLKKW